MPIKLLATGDIHIGRRSSALPAGAIEGATKHSWESIVETAIRQQVDALALSGDIIDQDNRYFEAIGPLQAGFARLQEAGVPVFLVAGNHDYEVLPQLMDPERFPDVHLLGANGQWGWARLKKDGQTIQMVGWSFPRQYVSDDPTASFSTDGLDPELPTIGLLHGEVNVPESKYAPISLDKLLDTKVDAWILGHIHKPEILNESNPLVIYPGSPHALSPKETGIHGPMLIEIHSKENIVPSPIPLSPVRYELLSVDISGLDDKVELRDRLTSALMEDAEARITDLENVKQLVYDLLLTGRTGRIKEVEESLRYAVEDYEQEIGTAPTLLSVRKLHFDLLPAVENMEDLAMESSPAGILAGAIIAAREGRPNDFLDALKDKWKKMHLQTFGSGTYQPLRAAEHVDLARDEDPVPYIINECNRLLAELLAQQDQ